MAKAMTTEQEVAMLKRKEQALRKALGTLIAWLPQGANSPITHAEASRLLDLMEGSK